MENKTIDQKEYLKKYISHGDGDGDKKKKMKKKKKKKHKVGSKTVKIIDDDIDLMNMRPLQEDEFDILLVGEDAPQIAGIVDERGPVDFSDKRRWKIVTENEEGDLTISSRAINAEKQSRITETNAEADENDDVDPSPPRTRHSRNKRLDLSPHRQRDDDDSNLSPPTRRPRNYDSDLSSSRQSRNNDSDLSPPRQPPKDNHSDLSPSRRSTKQSTTATRGRNCHVISGNRDSDSSDFSPPRPRKQKPDTQDLYESRRNRRNNDSDLSASRRKEYRPRSDNSPHSSSRRSGDRGHDYSSKHSSRYSKQDVSRSSKDKHEREHEDRDRKSRFSHADDTGKRKRSSRWDDQVDSAERSHAKYSKDRDGRMTKTLDGKTAGLQDAKALREETEAHKRREAEQFSRLSKSVSGVGQAAVVRDKSGRKRNFEAEAAEERQREAQQREMNEKYTKWGKGLKQVEDREEQLKSDLHEMNKPLARYADDADLDKQLREQEREGDPMLAYIKEKRTKEGKGRADPPKYQGSFAPNRFGIKPGHRWDGVDRSNGYEKTWFEAQNSKVARQEEAYKWSTADM
ncbi:BUD13 homolog [Harpegnathos saltator]|uniref:BUD13 homolog n=1 Tax=Harpegnathos saltator TaxID=610380 RepID=UPI000DBEDB9C|nr:BUD13 homolog [Harpegnathos saltator]